VQLGERQLVNKQAVPWQLVNKQAVPYILARSFVLSTISPCFIHFKTLPRLLQIGLHSCDCVSEWREARGSNYYQGMLTKTILKGSGQLCKNNHFDLLLAYL